MATNGKPKAEKKAKQPKAKKQKLDKPKLIAEKIDELMVARREHGSAMIEWEEAHARAGELKKTMERKQAMLNGIVADIDNIRTGNFTPPLPFGEQPKAADVPGSLKADGPWRDVPMAEVIDGDILKKCEEAGIKTVGDYQNHAATDKPIPGIGQGKSGLIADAFIEFWKKHPEFCETGDKKPEPAAAEQEPVAAA